MECDYTELQIVLSLRAIIKSYAVLAWWRLVMIVFDEEEEE
jgi:hypothetical protein